MTVAPEEAHRWATAAVPVRRWLALRILLALIHLDRGQGSPVTVGHRDLAEIVYRLPANTSRTQTIAATLRWLVEHGLIEQVTKGGTGRGVKSAYVIRYGAQVQQ